MEKTLALDLGSNSIGWTLRDASFEKDQFRKCGVITFQTGVGKDDKGKFTVSFAQQRTSKRSIRRLYQARKYKLWAVLDALRKADYCPIKEEELNQWRWYKKDQGYFRRYPVEARKFNDWVKMDFDGDGEPDYTSPYQLREALVTEKLDLTQSINRYKIGRALYHIAQHRAFKSSKKVNTKDELDAEAMEIGAERKKHKELDKKLGELGLSLNDKTIGQVFAEAERLFKEQKEGRIRNNLHPHVTRKDLQREVEKILDFQNLDLSELFRDKKGNAVKIHRTPIFWQRPLRSQKGTIGKCTLEPSKFRSPVSHPSFEEFRAWSLLNNIKYKTKDDKEAEWQQLDLALRNKLYQALFIGRLKSNFEFFEIYDRIRKENGHDQWILNYNFKTNVSGCPVSARLYKIFGDDWTEVRVPHTPNEKRSKKKAYYDLEDIWHAPYSSDDEEFVHDFATEKLRLNESQTKNYLAMWESMPVDYAQLSLKAIRNINRFLRKGLIYTEAALLAKLPDIIGTDSWRKIENLMVDGISDVIALNRKTKKHLGIANNLIAKYKALPNQDQFAKHNFEYILKPSDLVAIENECKEVFGEQTWDTMERDKEEIRTYVETQYQQFFKDQRRQFKKMPHLQDSLKTFITKNFDVDLHQLKKLYHPSEIEIYPPAERKYYSEINAELALLGSPKTGAFKNPMAMRALHELRKLVNYLLLTNQIDEQTRIVVELARELNDANKRWAIEKYQNMREEENKEFSAAIHELIKDPDARGVVVNADNADDIDKFRLWYEMMLGDEAKVGFLKDKKFAENTSETKSRKNRGKEEEYEVFAENNYERINKQLYFKLKSAGDDVVKKYRLWKEQNCQCLYTGELISLTQLFQPNAVDFEHTLPRSKSFDNSLENLTVCKAEYNRKIKKNQIPTQLPNYEESGAGYPAIKPRLKPWEDKVEHLKIHIEFWKNKSKRASTKDDKDFAIRQKHLWQFELNYWRGKLERFQMDEIKKGFRNSQLVDTQIISKYALHYLKTVFNKVEVQKGSVTAEFRKILSIQPLDEQKDRSKHSHHAKDAVVLSVIPVTALREQILKCWYALNEKKKLINESKGVEREELHSDIEFLERRLSELLAQCRLPNVNKAIERIDDEILIHNVARDQTLSSAKKKIRTRGKVIGVKDANGKTVYKTDAHGNAVQYQYKGEPVYKRDHNGEWILKDGQRVPVLEPKEKWATGDIIRGQLHKESLYGAVKLIKKDEDGKFLKDENGAFEFEDIRYVIREELIYKKNAQSPGFSSIKDLEAKIVDHHLYKMIEKQVIATGDFKRTLSQGVWMIDKRGRNVNRIRRVRVFVRASNPIPVKKQSHQSEKPLRILDNRDHKTMYWAENKERPYYAMYILHNKLLPETFTLQEIAKRSQNSLLPLKDFNDLIEYQKKDGAELHFTLRKGQKLIFLKETINSYKDIPDYVTSSLYKVEGFEDEGSPRVTLRYHLESDSLKDIKNKMTERGLPAAGATTIDFDNPIPLLRVRLHTVKRGQQVYNYAIEGKHFEVLPDGEITWLF